MSGMQIFLDLGGKFRDTSYFKLKLNKMISSIFVCVELVTAMRTEEQFSKLCNATQSQRSVQSNPGRAHHSSFESSSQSQLSENPADKADSARHRLWLKFSSTKEIIQKSNYFASAQRHRIGKFYPDF